MTDRAGEERHRTAESTRAEEDPAEEKNALAAPPDDADADASTPPFLREEEEDAGQLVSSSSSPDASSSSRGGRNRKRRPSAGGDCGAHISEELAEALLADAEDGGGALTPPPPPVYEEEESTMPPSPQPDDDDDDDDDDDLKEELGSSLSESADDRCSNSFSPRGTDRRSTKVDSPHDENGEGGFINSFADDAMATAPNEIESIHSDPAAAATPSVDRHSASHQRQPSGLSPDKSPPCKIYASSTDVKSLSPLQTHQYQQQQQHQLQHQLQQQQHPAPGPTTTPVNIRPNTTDDVHRIEPRSPSVITYATPKSRSPPHHQQQRPGRRSVTLRLLEEIPQSPPPHPLSSPLLSSVGTPFRSLKKFRSLSIGPSAFSSLNYGRARSDSDGGLAPPGRKALFDNGTGENDDAGGGGEPTIDRGTIVVSWYEGTTSAEMHKHVFNCVLRKLNGGVGAVSHGKDGKEGGKTKLEDVRLFDENETPHGEVVLCPFLPDGSHFLLKFKTSIERPPTPPKVYRPPPYASRAPDSPSAEPSPFPSHANLASLDANNVRTGRLNMNDRMHQQQQQQNAQQMQLLKTVAALLQQQQQQQQQHPAGVPPIPHMEPIEAVPKEFPIIPRLETTDNLEGNATTPVAFNDIIGGASNIAAPKKAASGGATPKMESIAENSTTDQLIEKQLHQLNNLFAKRRSVSDVGGVVPLPGGGADATSAADSVAVNGATGVPTKNTAAIDEHPRSRQSVLVRAYYREEKKQVIFVIANYLVLFMGFIALSAEIQSRLPSWMRWVQQNYDSVQNCSTDRDALIECLSNGDFSGLVASFLLWATQSAAAKRIFLFGFDTPKKLWTVVYEALVTAVCWGTSYLFIRRGLNPNTREQFLHKYWKDAVYGSLAGFNAAFMKAVLKNLIPQDVALEALEGGRQLKIFHWLFNSLDE